MDGSKPVLRANPGGRLEPGQIVGRDAFIAEMWRALGRQSVLLTAERRMGKTSVLRKMCAEPTSGCLPIQRNLQGVATPEEFAQVLVADVEAHFPGLLRRSIGQTLSRAGVKKIGVSQLAVEFVPANDGTWVEVVDETLAVLDREPNVSVVLMWDELPHMVANIREARGPMIARQMLDRLRAFREGHDHVRMVFSGSIGLHHVVDGLREHGGMWAPTHDMHVMDLPVLAEPDAEHLAAELLRNEEIACDDVAVVARAVAGEVDDVPYYVHHLVDGLRSRQLDRDVEPVTAADVQRAVEHVLLDPLDPWQLQHYLDRVAPYYGPRAPLVRLVLDVIARAAGPRSVEDVHAELAAQVAPPAVDDLRTLLVLLSKDHYLGASASGYAFKLRLVERAWAAKRGLAG